MFRSKYFKLLIISINFVLFFNLFAVINKVNAESTDYVVGSSVDKQKVSIGEEFEITLQVENTGTKTIRDFEFRVPVYETLVDTTVVGIDPAFNKLLDSEDYPAGFNSKSWVINSFEPGSIKIFKIRYKVSDDPKSEGGINSTYTFPLTWNGPNSRGSGSEVTLKEFQTDIFVDSKYIKTDRLQLPTLDANDNEISKIKLNEKYYFEGSKSTNLKEVTKANIAAFPNFKLETKDILIEWQEPIDFSAEATVAAMKTFDTLFVPEWGKLGFDQTQLSFLAKKANITFKSVDSISDPKVKIVNDIKKLIEAKGSFSKESKSLSLPLAKLSSVSLYPNIQTEPDTLETSDKSSSIKVKVDNPKSQVSYSINGKDEKSVFSIDLNTGQFEIPIDDVETTDQVEVKVTYKNGEEAKKLVLINYKEIAPTTIPTQISPTKKSASNPVFSLLLMVAIAVGVITLGFIYYLIYSKRKEKKIKAIDNLKSVNLNNIDKTNADLEKKSSGIDLTNINTSVAKRDFSSYLNKDSAPSDLQTTSVNESPEINLRRDVLSPNSDNTNQNTTKQSDENDSFLKKE